MRGSGIRAAAVVRSRTAVQGLAAMAVFDPALSAPKNLAAMISSASATRHGAVTVASKDALTSAGATGAAVIEGFVEARKRITDFLADRIRQDIEVQSELLGCRNLDDVREVQSRFFRAAIDQYAAEASRMMRLGTDVMAKSLDRSRG